MRKRRYVMHENDDLYKRAASKRTGNSAVWHVDRGRMLFAAPLYHNAMHRHGAPICLTGIYDRFELRVPGGDWLTCHSAVIPAGVPHELNVHGNPVAGLYIEPSWAGVHALTPLIGHPGETQGLIVGRFVVRQSLRALWEYRDSPRWAAQLLDEWLGFAAPRVRRALDRRITATLTDLDNDTHKTISVSSVARRVGLSSSRFQHLFRRELGVPYRRYRGWLRLRDAIGEIVSGRNFTTAAHAAAFSDQPHFNRAFRDTFGAAPSVTLRNIRGGREEASNSGCPF